FLDEDAWYAEHEEDIADMTLPMVVLSELIEDEDLAQIRQDQRIINEMAKQIPELITSLYLLFHAPANA
ncbi:MAG: YecA family protein, partial [Moraxellaceae bacterium]|nr:YecA family protein [Moraxellaceae bacterium]